MHAVATLCRSLARAAQRRELREWLVDTLTAVEIAVGRTALLVVVAILLFLACGCSVAEESEALAQQAREHAEALAEMERDLQEIASSPVPIQPDDPRIGELQAELREQRQAANDQAIRAARIDAQVQLLSDTADALNPANIASGLLNPGQFMPGFGAGFGGGLSFQAPSWHAQAGAQIHPPPSAPPPMPAPPPAAPAYTTAGFPGSAAGQSITLSQQPPPGEGSGEGFPIGLLGLLGAGGLGGVLAGNRRPETPPQAQQLAQPQPHTVYMPAPTPPPPPPAQPAAA